MKRAQTIEINELEAGALNAFLAIEALLRPSRMPLSHFRHRLMFVSYEGDGSELCHEMPPCEKLAAVAARSAVDWFVARKEVLHASGTVDGEPFQQIGWEADGPPLMRADLAAAGVEATFAKLVHQEGQVAHDLQMGPLIRRREHKVLYAAPVRIRSFPCRGVYQLGLLPDLFGQNDLERVEGSEASGAPSQLCWRSHDRALDELARYGANLSATSTNIPTPEGTNQLRGWLIGAAGQRRAKPHSSNSHKLMNWQRDNHPRSSSCG